jgi:ketosteroid isomerase-like protein
MNIVAKTVRGCLSRKRRRNELQCTLLGVVIFFFGLSGAAGARAQGSGGAGATAGMSGSDADSDAIRGIIAKYAKAVDDADTNLASQIWSHSADVSFVYPLGREKGIEQILRNIYEQAMGDTFSERELNIHDVSIHVYGEAAWAEFDWDFAAKLKKDGSPVATHGMETQIYRKEARGWRLVHVHYSALAAAVEQRP